MAIVLSIKAAFSFSVGSSMSVDDIAAEDELLEVKFAAELAI